jgi:hypothetical protein
MKNELIRKGLIFGMVLLFVGTSVVSAKINTNQNKAVDKDYTTSTTERTYYNLIGGVNITYDFRGTPTVVKIEWWRAKDRNFTYPVKDGNVKINYTIELQSYSNGFFFVPRLSSLLTLAYAYYPEEKQIGADFDFIIVPFWKSYGSPRSVKYIFVESGPIPPPPPEPNSTKSIIKTWDVAMAIIIPAVTLGNRTSNKWIDTCPIMFWANFTQG